MYKKSRLGNKLRMIKSTSSIFQVKQAIQDLYQKAVNVTVDLGRNRTVNYLGKLTGVYPALFTVSPVDKDFKGKTSYSYSEYMCGRVKLSQAIDKDN